MNLEKLETAKAKKSYIRGISNIIQNKGLELNLTLKQRKHTKDILTMERRRELEENIIIEETILMENGLIISNMVEVYG